MDVFKLFESTVPEIQLDYADAKDLRRDQLLDNYDAAVKALQCLINAKENEIAYRRGLVEMLEQAKSYYDKKKHNSSSESIDDDHGEQTNNFGKKYVPEDTLTPHSNPSTTPISSGTTPAGPVTPSSSQFHQPTLAMAGGDQRLQPNSSSSYQPSKDSDLNIPPPDRTSLDNRLSEFLKTYPILSQAGLASGSAGTTSSTDNPNNNLLNSGSNNVRPSPGYYTQQPPPPPTSSMTAVPPLVAMMRFPPPPMIPPPPPPNQQLSSMNLASSQENHEMADMDLSDHDDQQASKAGGIIPMVASAMQQGAGGKHGIPRGEQPSYGAGGYNNQPVQYPAATSRMGALPFDPSIMDPTFSSPMSSGSSSRDKHSHNDRGSHRHSSSSGGSKHGSDKGSKYSSSSQSSSSSSKNKRR